ncbi:MAG: alginate export family protein [Acidobacteriota bacterium]
MLPSTTPTFQWSRVLTIAILGFLAGSVAPAEDESADPTVVYEKDGLTVRWHFQAGLNAPAEENLFWELAETFAPDAEFDADAQWLEAYFKPGLSFTRGKEGGQTFYGKVSAVGSYTSGTDAFDTGDSGEVNLEEAYLGLRGGTEETLLWDVSLGLRELRLGTGMIIASGGSSGFERGALKFGPRKAWEQALIVRLAGRGLTGTFFYIDPNERPATDGETELAGIDVRWAASTNQYLGATYVHVLESTSPYPQAPPGGSGAPVVVPAARGDLNTVTTYGRILPFDGALQHLFLAADLAIQWNDRIDLEAWAGRLQAGITFPKRTWSPSWTYTYQTFSGDDPDTSTLERFDPLFYEGNPNAWSTGSKSSMTFINSNVNAHSLAFRVQPTPRDTWTLRYSHIRANELRSPIQFGQAARVDVAGPTSNVVSGVTEAHLSDDVFLEYNRVLNRHTFLSFGAAVSFPGRGIDDAIGRSAPNWTGGFLNIVVNF